MHKVESGMSIEIKNFCINVSVVPKPTSKNQDAETLRSDILKNCRQLIQDFVSECRDR